MEANVHNNEFYTRSCSDPALTKALLQESLKAGNLEAAMTFVENLSQLEPDSYTPIHAKCVILFQKNELGDIGLLLADAADRFGDDPNYIIDRLAYTIEVMGTAAAKKYLEKIGSKPAYESEEFLKLCARIYNAEGDEEKFIKCLFILHKQFHSEHARFLLAVKSMEHQKYEAALKWYVAVINDYTGSPEYFMALAGRCVMLQKLVRDNWREEMQKAALEIELASNMHIFNLWLQSISEQLWELLGNQEMAEHDRSVIAELEKYAEDPKGYMQSIQSVNNGETRK